MCARTPRCLTKRIRWCSSRPSQVCNELIFVFFFVSNLRLLGVFPVQTNDPSCTAPVCNIDLVCKLMLNETVGTPLQRLINLNQVSEHFCDYKLSMTTWSIEYVFPEISSSYHADFRLFTARNVWMCRTRIRWMRCWTRRLMAVTTAFGSTRHVWIVYEYLWCWLSIPEGTAYGGYQTCDPGTKCLFTTVECSCCVRHCIFNYLSSESLAVDAEGELRAVRRSVQH